MNAHDDAMLELASLHGLGVLPPEEAEPLDAHLQACDQCRAAFMESAAIAAGLGRTLAAGAPPALRSRVLSAIQAQRGVSDAGAVTTEVTTLRRSRPTPWARWSLSGGVIAALTVAIVVALSSQHARAPQPQPTALAQARIYKSWTAACSPKPCASGGTVVAFVSGAIRLNLTGLRALPKHKVYQAWVIRPNALHPIPEPTFTADAGGNGSVVFAAKIGKGTVVAITVEPLGGSKAPTTKPFLTASLD